MSLFKRSGTQEDLKTEETVTHGVIDSVPSTNIPNLPQTEQKDQSLDPSIKKVNHQPKPSMTMECSICFAQRSNAIISECGHGGICYDCGLKMLKLQPVCPFCRRKAVAVYKIEKTARPSILQASDAAVYITPGEDKKKIFENMMNPPRSNDP